LLLVLLFKLLLRSLKIILIGRHGSRILIGALIESNGTAHIGQGRPLGLLRLDGTAHVDSVEFFFALRGELTGGLFRLGKLVEGGLGVCLVSRGILLVYGLGWLGHHPDVPLLIHQRGPTLESVLKIRTTTLCHVQSRILLC